MNLDQMNDVFHLLAFFALLSVTAVAFYILGQFIDGLGHKKKKQLLEGSLNSHKRLTKELKHETDLHRKIAEEYREAFDKKEDYWVSVKKRWQDEAEKARQIIAQQEEIRTKHVISLKEANRKLISIENEYQQNKRDSLAQINVLKANNEEPEKLKEYEAKSAEVDKKYTTEIELKRSKIVELQANLKKRDEKLSKLENIILKKNSDISELKANIQQNGELGSKLAAANASLTENEKRYEAVKLDLKTRNESLAELERKLQESQLKVGELEELASIGSELEDIKKTMFIKETQLVEKESVMKKLAEDLDQKQHQVGLLQTDLNARNQKLTALVSQMEDTSDLDEAMQKIGMLTSEVKGKDEQISALKEKLEGVELVFEKQKQHVSDIKEQGVLKETTIEKLNKDLDERGAKLSRLQAQIKELEQALVKKDSDINSLNKQLKDNTQIDQLRVKIKEFEVQLKAREEEIDKLVDESKSKNAKIAELEKRLADKENQCKEMSSKLMDTSERDALNQRLSLMQSQLTEKDAILSKAQETISQEKSKATRLIEDGKKPMEELANLRKQLSAKEKELEELDRSNVAHESKIESLESLVSEKETDIQSQREAIADIEMQLQDKTELEKISKQVEALKATNDHQQTLLTEHHRVVDTNKKRAQELESKLGEKENQIQKLQDELQAVRSQKTKDLNELNALRKQAKDSSERDALAVELDQLKGKLSIKQKQLDESHDANVARQKRIEELERHLGERDSAAIKLSDQIKGLERKVCESSAMIDDLNIQIADRSEVELVKQKLGFFQTDIMEKEGSISDLSKSLKERESRISELEHFLNERDTQISSFGGVQDELAEKKRTYALLHSDYQASIEKSKDLEKHNSGKQQRIDELEGYLRDTHSEINALKSELQDTSKVDALAAELAQKTKELDLLDQHSAEVRKELDTKSKQLAESHAEVERLQGELANTGELDNLKMTLKNKESAIHNLQSQLDGRGAEIKTLHAKVVDTSVIEKLKSELDEHQKSVQSLTDEKSQLSEKNEVVERHLLESHLEVERLRKELSDTSKMDVLHRQIAAKQERIDLLLGENKDKHERLIELEKTTIHQSDELVKLQQSVANTSEMDHLREEVNQRDLTLNSIRQEAEVAQARAQELETLRNTHLAEITGLRAELNSVNQKLTDTSHVDDLKNQLDHKIGFINSLSNQTSEKESKISELERALANSQRDIESLKQLADDTSEVDNIREALNYKTVELNKLTQLMEKKDEILNELEAALNHAKSELLTIKSSINDTSEIDGLKDQLSSKNRQLDELHKENVAHQDQVATLKSSVLQKQNELERAIAKANDRSELTLLKEKLEEREGRVKFLSDKASTTVTRLEELEKHVEARDSEISKLQDKLSDTSKLDKIISELEQKEALVTQLSDESTKRVEQVNQLEQTLKELQDKYAGKDEEILDLRNQVSELTKQSMLSSFGGGNVEQDKDKGIIYLSEPEKKDNLGDIFGVSTELESQLNALGIYRHKQIALWSDRQVDYFQENLDFDGNIRREQWAIQAQRLEA